MASVTATFAMDKEAVEFARAQEEAEAKIRAADAARAARKTVCCLGRLSARKYTVTAPEVVPPRSERYRK
jgi:hypothetical protein